MARGLDVANSARLSSLSFNRRFSIEAYNPLVRYVVYDPKDPRKGHKIVDPLLGQILLGEGATITKALTAAAHGVPLASGSVVWDRKDARVAYRVP